MSHIKGSQVLIFVIVLLMECVVIQESYAGPVIFNDYDSFRMAVGNVRVIDFETLPDGSFATGGESITPEFNYTNQGVTFGSPTGDPIIVGNTVSGFGLAADGYNQQQHTWITANLTQPTYALGFFGPGAEFLTFFDVEGTLLVEAVVPGNLADWFVGIVSEVPIGSAIADLGGTNAQIQATAVAVIPEPTTIVLLVLGSVAVVRKRLS